MPYLHIKVGKPLCEQSVDALRKECESIISLIPGKNADNCMIQIETDCTMYMKGEKKACAFVDLRLYKASPADTKQAFATALTNYLQEKLGLEANLIYMNILELDSWVAGGTII